MHKIEPAPLLRRVVALFIDLGLLYLAGYILSLILEEQILALGNFKLLIGIFLSTAYFTYFHSNHGKGQTLGKKLFNYRVLKLDGSFLSLKEAFLRSVIFTIPYSLSDLLSINIENSIGIFDFFRNTIFPAALFINHFSFFTNPLRQCYYDSLLGCAVIGAGGEPQETKLQSSLVKYFPYIFMLTVIIFGLIRLHPFSADNMSDLKQLSEIREPLTQERHLHFSKFYFTYPKNDPYNKTLKIDCYMTGDQDISSEVYLITEELSPLKDKFQIKKITLSVIRDFNLGIYNSWEVLKKNEKPMRFDL